MRFQFDANQTYQLRPVDTVAALFRGLIRDWYTTAVRVMNLEADFETARYTDPFGDAGEKGWPSGARVVNLA